VIAIDNNDMNDEEVGVVHHRLELDQTAVNFDQDAEKAMRISRRHFNSAQTPVAFPVILRQLTCDSCHNYYCYCYYYYFYYFYYF
jgi:hypothetical protein